MEYVHEEEPAAPPERTAQPFHPVGGRGNRRSASGPFAQIARSLLIGTRAIPADGIGPGRALLAAAMIGLGIRGLVVGDFASVWQRIPIEHLPARQVFAYACAAIEVATGVGLLVRRTLAIASAVLFVFLALWVILLKLPAVVAAPQMEASWLGFGEIACILAGGWILFATYSGAWARRHLRLIVGADGVRAARLLFVLALPMIGLSHFVYVDQTAQFVPAWLPLRHGWAWLTGAGNIAAAIGLLFAIWPRLAATLEAAMQSVITLLVWLPGVIAAPGNESWTPFLMSSAIACGAWVVADSYRGIAWLTRGSACD